MIKIDEYNQEWPKFFSRHGHELRSKLGHLVDRIDHIGSTSVPGLSAKSVIDIQVSVLCFDKHVHDVLLNSGYINLPHIINDHIHPGEDKLSDQWVKRFYKNINIEFPVNLHLRIKGNKNQRYAILFRDYLRCNPAACLAYSEIKKVLANKYGEDVDSYYDIKDPVCDIILSGAEFWAKSSGWLMNNSDQ